MDQQVFNQKSPMQNHSTPVNYAGFLRRSAAAFIDTLINFIITWPVSFMIGTDPITSFSFSTIFGIIYYAVFDSSDLMGTPGKALMSIAIVTESQQSKITFKKAVIRHLLKMVSMAMLFMGYFMQAFTSKRQTLHDMLAEVVVIKKNAPEVNYFTVFKNNFTRLIND